MYKFGSMPPVIHNKADKFWFYLKKSIDMEISEFIEKFAEAIDVDDASSLTPDMDFREIDEWSSISVMLLIAYYEDEFDKQIFSSDIRACKTINDLYALATS